MTFIMVVGVWVVPWVEGVIGSIMGQLAYELALGKLARLQHLGWGGGN